MQKRIYIIREQLKIITNSQRISIIRVKLLTNGRRENDVVIKQSISFQCQIEDQGHIWFWTAFIVNDSTSPGHFLQFPFCIRN